jgi:hypothetical protein
MYNFALPIFQSFFTSGPDAVFCQFFNNFQPACAFFIVFFIAINLNNYFSRTLFVILLLTSILFFEEILRKIVTFASFAYFFLLLLFFCFQKY